MSVWNTLDIVSILRERLEPAARADFLADGQYPHARKAAVLLGLFDRESEISIIFIRRASSLRLHGGEIAFPGGGADHTDSSLVMTALREAREEIGLNPANVEVLGVLSPVFTFVSNYLVVPVVAYLASGLGMLQLQASEVTEIMLVPLHKLADPTISHTEEWSRDGQTHTVYFYDYGPYRIWGATARMLNVLLTVLESR